MPNSAVWRRNLGRLKSSSGRRLREALPLLRVAWPHLVDAREMDAMDRAGIDLVGTYTTDRIDIAVQCKGFEIASIGEAQADAALKSIKKFRDSDFECDEYLLLYNRFDAEFEALVQGSLEELVQLGKAAQATVVGVSGLQSMTARAMRARIDVGLKAYAEAEVHRQQRLSSTGAIVRIVPVHEERLTFVRYSPCERGPVGTGEINVVTSSLNGIEPCDGRFSQARLAVERRQRR